MSEKSTTEYLLKCAINRSNCSIVDAFREFHQSGEISNNAELILDAAEFFQKLAKELQLENEQLAKDKVELVEALNTINEHRMTATAVKRIVAEVMEKHK